MEQYEKLERLGEGTYGAVYKVRHKKPNEIVAVKMFFSKEDDKGCLSTAIREITLLKLVKHENVIRVHDVVCDGKVYLLLEYLDFDLRTYMKSCPEFSKNLTLVKMILYQILCGIACCHSHRVVHRDLKPGNLLIDRKNNVVKIADFGLARNVHFKIRSLTKDVGTLRYMAPEVLLGSRMYYTPVDVWSVGCIFAEMVIGKPLFKGKTEIDQLFRIFKILGTPEEDTWPGVTSYPRFDSNVQRCPRKDLASVVPNLDENGLDLLSKMLYMDPDKRITAQAALEHEYFKDIRTCTTRFANSLQKHYAKYLERLIGEELRDKVTACDPYKIIVFVETSNVSKMG
ncbi:cell division control protein 2 homolog A-like [Rutidosis leptorrhynchoides]|uniref:cell division control protein 2 homolog A-like n=1 Tax=Rutidosis leptorrhynchoides TaxID=125765 RepID=UPI003A99FCF2